MVGGGLVLALVAPLTVRAAVPDIDPPAAVRTASASGGAAGVVAEDRTEDRTTETIEVRGPRILDSSLVPRPDHAVALETRPLRMETLGEVVGELPGVALFRRGGVGASQTVSIRGAAFDQTAVLIDDIPVIGPDRGSLDFSLLPLDGFERVELFRGSAPVRYGVGTIGGVVRLVPKAPGARGVRLRLSAGSFDTYEVRGEVEADWGPVSFTASGGALFAENDFVYLDDNATRFDPTDDFERVRQNAGVARGNAFAMAAWQDGPHRLAALGLFIHQERGAPGPATRVSLGSDQRRTRLFGSLGYRFQGHVGPVPLDLFATVASGWDRDRFRDPFGEIGLGRQEDTRDTFFSLDARAGGFLGILPGWTVGGTLFYRLDDIRPNNRLASPGDQPSSRDLLTVSAETRVEGRSGAVELSLRGSVSALITWARLTGSRLGGIFVRRLRQAVPSYRIEGTVKPFHYLEFSMQLASGLQLPTTLELFGNRETVVGNLALRSERSTSVDGKMSLATGVGPLDLAVEVGLFWRSVKDVIVARRTAVNQVAFRNERDAATLGVETWMHLDLADRLRLTTALTFLSSTFDYRGLERDYPLRSPFRIFQRVSGHLRPSGVDGVVGELAAFAELEHRSGLFPGAANLADQPAYTSVNTGVRVFLWTQLTAEVLLRNIFDPRGLDLLAFPRPGRAVELSLEWRHAF